MLLILLWGMDRYFDEHITIYAMFLWASYVNIG